MSGEAVHGKQSAAVELERLLRDERDKSVDSIERILHYFAIAHAPNAGDDARTGAFVIVELIRRKRGQFEKGRSRVE